MTFKTLLFDYDYTLADSSTGIIRCFELTLAEMGMGPYDPQAIRATIGLSLEKSYHQLTGDASPGRATRFTDRFREHGREHLVPNTVLLPGVPEALAIVYQAGYTLGIMSTKYTRLIVPVLRAHQLDHYFGAVVGGDQVPQVKPDPAGVLKAMAELGAQRDTTLYVGDSPTDGHTCANAGIAFCAVLSGVTPREQLEVFEPWYLADDVLDLAHHLVRLAREA